MGILGFAARLAFSLAVLWGCLSYLGLDELLAARVSVTTPSLLAALLLTGIGSIVIPALITRQAFDIRRVELSLSELVMVNFAIRSYVLVLPRAAAMGARWAGYRRGGSGRDALALMVFEPLARTLKSALLSRTGQQTVSLYASQLALLAMGVATTTMHAHVLGPADYGVLAFYLTFTRFVAAFFGFGFFGSSALLLARASNATEPRR